MKYGKSTAVTAILLLLTITVCQGADVAKIGVVDFQKILTESSAGQGAQAQINDKGKKMESELRERGEAIERQKEAFDREALVMSKEMRDEKEKELRVAINDFKTIQKKYLGDFKELEKQVVTKIRDDVLAMIENIAKKEGYLMIMEKREGGLLYYPNSMDLTDRIIKALNAKGGS